MKFHPRHWQTGMRSQNGGCLRCQFSVWTKAYPLTMTYETLLNWHLFDCYGNQTPKYFAFLRQSTNNSKGLQYLKQFEELYILIYVYMYIYMYIYIYIYMYIYICVFWYDYAAELPRDSSCWGGERYLQGSILLTARLGIAPWRFGLGWPARNLKARSDTCNCLFFNDQN